MVPTEQEIAVLDAEELDRIFTRILESESGLGRGKEGFRERYYEHCEALRRINAARRHLRGEAPQRDNAHWNAHASRTWRTQKPLALEAQETQEARP